MAGPIDAEVMVMSNAEASMRSQAELYAVPGTSAN